MLARVRQVSARALESGALRTIETEHVMTGGALPFMVRRAVKLARKDAAARQRAAAAVAPAARKRDGDFNPFLPYEEELYVEHVTPEHVVLLNKVSKLTVRAGARIS